MTAARCPPAAAALAAVALLACGGEGPQPTAHDPELVLDLDGIRIHRADLAPWLDYIASIDRRAGRDRAVRAVLEQHLLPVALARRAFAERRAELRAACEAMHRAVGNGGYPELINKARHLVGERGHAVAGRYELPLALQPHAFDEERVGHVSPVVETPQGFCLLAVWQVRRGVSRTDDVSELYQVPFYHHDADEFAAWLQSAQAAVADRLDYVHPDYRDALPPWIARPKG